MIVSKKKLVPTKPPNRAARSAAMPDSLFDGDSPIQTDDSALQFERILNSREAADLLRMHHKTLERKARRGEIPGYYYNGCWHFRASELDAWLKTAVNSGIANPSVLNRRIA